MIARVGAAARRRARADGSPAAAGRAWLVAALVCGSFGIGVSEFVVMGLLPQIAADLLPAVFAEDPERAVAQSGAVVSCYALGVVVGLVVTPLVLRRRSLRATLLISAAAMFAGTLATAAAPALGAVVALRFLSAFTHAAYVGVASILVGRMLGPRRQGRGASLVLGGFAIANLLGVPLGTQLGIAGDWRLVLACCSVLFLAPVLALLRAPGWGTDAPSAGRAGPGGSGSVPRLATLAVIGTAIATGGFALVTFVAPVAARLQAGAEAPLSVAVCMLVFGVGMNAGNFGGGWLADVSPDGALLTSGVCGAIGAALLCVPAASGATAVLGMLATGLAIGAYSPAGQILFVGAAPRWPRLAASLVSGTTNLGSFAGAAAGGLVLGGFGAGAVPLVALALLVVGAGLQAVRAVRASAPPAPTVA